MSTPTTITVTVAKGCPALGIKKGSKAAITLEAIAGYGVRATGFGRSLWLSGNRVNVPSVTVGRVLNLHNGNPLNKVAVEVVGL